MTGVKRHDLSTEHREVLLRMEEHEVAGRLYGCQVATGDIGAVTFTSGDAEVDANMMQTAGLMWESTIEERLQGTGRRATGLSQAALAEQGDIRAQLTPGQKCDKFTSLKRWGDTRHEEGGGNEGTQRPKEMMNKCWEVWLRWK